MWYNSNSVGGQSTPTATTGALVGKVTDAQGNALANVTITPTVQAVNNFPERGKDATGCWGRPRTAGICLSRWCREEDRSPPQ